MAKNYTDPEFGEMIGIAEVELLTGITKAQLRNWRKPEHHHLAKFDIYEGVGNAVWYRKMDIEAYLAEHGALVGQSGLKRISMPNAISAPLIDVKFVGAQRDALHKLNKITTETVDSWLDQRIEIIGISMNTEWKRTYTEVQEILGLERRPVSQMLRNSNPDFLLTAVHAARLIFARENELEMTTDEVMSIPIGANPPVREIKYVP